MTLLLVISKHASRNSHLHVVTVLINPRRACASVTVAVLCVCVCVSTFSILPYYSIRRQTRDISGYSAENTAKKVVFSRTTLFETYVHVEAL